LELPEAQPSGVYNESVALTASGTAAAPVVFDGQGVAVIDGSAPTAIQCCTSPAFVANNDFVGATTQGLFTIGASNGVSHLTVEGFTVRNYTTASTTNVPAGILIVGGGTDINVLNNTVTGITSTAKQSRNAGPNAYGIGVFGTSSTPRRHGTPRKSVQKETPLTRGSRFAAYQEVPDLLVLLRLLLLWRARDTKQPLCQ